MNQLYRPFKKVKTSFESHDHQTEGGVTTSFLQTKTPLTPPFEYLDPLPEDTTRIIFDFINERDVVLPTAIQNTIIDFLDVPDLHEMMLTCRFYHQVCSSDAYWNKFTRGLLETFFDNVFVDRPNAPVPISQRPLNSTNMTTWLKEWHVLFRGEPRTVDTVDWIQEIRNLDESGYFEEDEERVLSQEEKEDIVEDLNSDDFYFYTMDGPEIEWVSIFRNGMDCPILHSYCFEAVMGDRDSRMNKLPKFLFEDEPCAKNYYQALGKIITYGRSEVYDRFHELGLNVYNNDRLCQSCGYDRMKNKECLCEFSTPPEHVESMPRIPLFKFRRAFNVMGMFNDIGCLCCM